jgi:hypothetical protein
MEKTRRNAGPLGWTTGLRRSTETEEWVESFSGIEGTALGRGVEKRGHGLCLSRHGDSHLELCAQRTDEGGGSLL